MIKAQKFALKRMKEFAQEEDIRYEILESPVPEKGSEKDKIFREMLEEEHEEILKESDWKTVVFHLEGAAQKRLVPLFKDLDELFIHFDTSVSEDAVEAHLDYSLQSDKHKESYLEGMIEFHQALKEITEEVTGVLK